MDGFAASRLGRPRVSGDVDALVLVDDEAWKGFVALGAELRSLSGRVRAVLLDP